MERTGIAIDAITCKRQPFQQAIRKHEVSPSYSRPIKHRVVERDQSLVQLSDISRSTDLRCPLERH